MKLFTRSSMILQQLTRLKLRSVLSRKTFHHTHILIRPVGIEISERTARKGSKPSSKHQTNITNDWICNNAILQTFHGLVDETRYDAILNLLFLQIQIFLDILLNVRLDIRVNGLLLSIVCIKSLSGLLAQPALFNHVRHDADIAALHAHAQISIGQERGHFRSYIHADLICQGNRTHRHAEILHRLVQCFQRCTVANQCGYLD
mmetsp:Transcript_8886/g.13082  ORF Transcript_8886/g.13082 Transcript_8886/m.13082 type:complete len:204 (-) Transcript_8886:1971-2582(-)